MTNDTEATYTLAEADRKLRRQACANQGHDFSFLPRRLMDEAPAGIICDRCGWAGVIRMDPKS